MKQIEKSLDEERQFMHSLKVMASKLETDIEKELSVNPDLLNTKKYKIIYYIRIRFQK